MSHKILIINNRSETIDKLTGCIQSLNMSVDTIRPTENFQESEYRGIVVSGGVLPKDNYKTILEWYHNLFETIETPILGICLGLRIIGYCYGARIRKLEKEEKGFVTITFHEDYPLSPEFKKLNVYEDHMYTLITLPERFRNYGKSETCEIQAVKHMGKKIFAVQFHPEVYEGNQGKIILENFVHLCLNSSRSVSRGKGRRLYRS